MFGLPTGLARPLSRRMRAVNAELDRIAAHYGTLHWDASTDPETYDRRNWSVDRLHPNERGHRLIACRFWDRLRAAGVPVTERPAAEPTSPPPTRRDDVAVDGDQGHHVVPAPLGRPHPLHAVHGRPGGAGRAAGVAGHGPAPHGARQRGGAHIAARGPGVAEATGRGAVAANRPRACRNVHLLRTPFP